MAPYILPLLIYVISPFTSVATASIDGVEYKLYVADTPIKHAVGYMNATSYDPRGVGAVGMVFIFSKNSTYCFWMKNTALPLRIVWTSGVKVTHHAVGVPHDVRSVCGFGDKVFELRPDISTPKSINMVGEQRLLH